MSHPSVMKHNFSQIPAVQIPRSVFDRSHGYKTTLDSGYLVPIFADEALPGDSFTLRANCFGRLATPKCPFMDNLFFETFYFAVPIRLIWANWKKMNGEQANPNDSTDYLVPQVVADSNGFNTGSVADYLGIPVNVPNLSVSALWHRAYNLIYQEWFKDQNLITSPYITTGDGPDAESNYPLRRRTKRHDYFTSALPWPQKGPGVEIPLGSTAPVWGNGKSLGLSYYATPALGPFGMNVDSGSDALWMNKNAYNQNVGTTITLDSTVPSAIRAVGVVTKNAIPSGTLESGLYADLSEATAANINSLRQAFQLQRLYERDARGGTRYTEIIRAHFGVVSPDARLQRPEFLGSSSSRININPVQQTSGTGTTGQATPQGNLAAFGLMSDTQGGFTKSFTEHCVILGLCNIRADITYQKGLNRMFSRRSRFDFYWPALAHLGEQEILNKEIYCDNTANDALVFGYQERFAEYRYKPSMITGKFRSEQSATGKPGLLPADGTLDRWHLSQNFANLPTLNETFINDNPPIERVVAITSEPQFLLDVYFNLKCARPMPVYSVPGMIDHF